MSVQVPLVPEIDWLATASDVDDSWLGPDPKLVNLRAWMDSLVVDSHRHLVAASFAAANSACQHWNRWFLESPTIAMESILESEPPPQQLAAVANWLKSPTAINWGLAFEMVDHTKQLHWFHEEYSDCWFQEPGMWAVESSEYCVLSHTGDPYSPEPVALMGAISISCAINSFRASAEEDVRKPLSIVLDAIRRQFEQMV